VQMPVTMLHCILLYGSKLVLAVRQGPKNICWPLNISKTAALSGAG